MDRKVEIIIRGDHSTGRTTIAKSLTADLVEWGWTVELIDVDGNKRIFNKDGADGLAKIKVEYVKEGL